MFRDYRYWENKSHYYSPPVSVFSLLSPVSNIINVEVHNDDMILFNCAPHHSGIWVFMTTSSSGIDNVLLIKSITVTTRAATLVPSVGDMVKLQCEAQSLLLFKESQIIMEWLHDGKVLRSVFDADVRA